ncbi:unannotated protein [freshwater metagenome]|uniref:Unannotated protein n=1 Tax=freshwater metagenome TaxID=449393 RepID=A0A6J7KYB3_9ZZZZ
MVSALPLAAACTAPLAAGAINPPPVPVKLFVTVIPVVEVGVPPADGEEL